MPQCPIRRKILIAGALGVPQTFYAPFATWLAGYGAAVLTFDLRGCGQSRAPRFRRSLRGFSADFLTWARSDFVAAMDVLTRFGGGVPVTVLGHSLGTQLAGMTRPDVQQRISLLVPVASGAGHWRDWAAPSRRIAPLLLYAIGPLLTAVFGYFPGKRLGLVGDLPAGAMRQWMQWCRHRDFSWGASPEDVALAYRQARFPIRALGAADDEAISPVAISKLLAAFENCPSSSRMLAYRPAGEPSIGHVGMFRVQHAASLWPELRDVLFET